jgi:hypothetical protein
MAGAGWGYSFRSHSVDSSSPSARSRCRQSASAVSPSERRLFSVPKFVGSGHRRWRWRRSASHTGISAVRGTNGLTSRCTECRCATGSAGAILSRVRRRAGERQTVRRPTRAHSIHRTAGPRDSGIGARAGHVLFHQRSCQKCALCREETAASCPGVGQAPGSARPAFAAHSASSTPFVNIQTVIVSMATNIGRSSRSEA